MSQGVLDSLPTACSNFLKQVLLHRKHIYVLPIVGRGGGPASCAVSDQGSGRRMRSLRLVVVFSVALSLIGVTSSYGQETASFDLRASEFSTAREPGLSHKQPGAFSFPVVRPGQEIRWKIWCRLLSTGSEGLALVAVDLVQDSENPEKFDIPPAEGVPIGLQNFSRPDGISNPGEGGSTTGYIGVQRGAPGEMNLVQIGGAQNTLGVPGSDGVGESTNVVPGVGLNQDVLLARGAFLAPSTPGRYEFRITNAKASVLDEVNVPPAFSPVRQATVVYDLDSFTIVVVAP